MQPENYGLIHTGNINSNTLRIWIFFNRIIRPRNDSSWTPEIPSLEVIAAEIIIGELPSFKNAQIDTRLL